MIFKQCNKQNRLGIFVNHGMAQLQDKGHYPQSNIFKSFVPFNLEFYKHWLLIGVDGNNGQVSTACFALVIKAFL